MSADWTARLIAKLHTNRISKKQLAKQLNFTPEYVSMVLNGHRNPSGAELEFSKALDSLIHDKQKEECSRGKAH